MKKKRQSKQDKEWAAKFDLAARFEDEIFAHKDLCPIYHTSEVLGIALAHHLKMVAKHNGLEEMDAALSNFVGTLCALIEPDEKDDPELKLNVSIRIERQPTVKR